MKKRPSVITIMKKDFIECPKEDCEWNIGWLGGQEWTRESGEGTRICNLGAKAMRDTGAMPPDKCPYLYEVIEMARSEFGI